MAVNPEVLEQLRSEPEVELDLSWLDPPSERGVRAQPGKHGLTVESIQLGSYGDVPDETHNFSMRPRGAAPRAGAQRLGIRWDEKTAAWSDAAAMLYEEAQQRQWSSARDIPWQELQPLPEDVELAMCQLCTFLTQVEFIAGDVPGRWLQHISPDFYEVALFLSTQVMDEARHLDVFRKRALANGGGLLQAGPGAIALLTAEDFTEMTATLHLVGEGFVQSVFRMGELIAKNEVDKRIFRLSAQDESRHVAFGVTHIKYVVDSQPERKEEIHSFLDRQEGLLGVGSTQAGLTGGGATGEALAILLGGGKDNIDNGYQTLLAIRRRQVNEYMQRLTVCGLGDRRERMAPGLRMFLEQSQN